jgi:hypothetical protein
MILCDAQSDGLEFAGLAFRALFEAGLPQELAKEMAIAAGMAAMERGWEISELHFHLARLLHEQGHGDFAEPLLLRALPGKDAPADAALKIPPGLFPLLRSGVLKPSGGDSWRLDATAIESPGEGLELAYARLMEVFSHQLIGLWRETGGRGQLQLAGWKNHARKFARRRGEMERRCREWRRDLEDALEHRARGMGWSESPSVVFAEPL